jgi:hypothetical protein
MDIYMRFLYSYRFTRRHNPTNVWALPWSTDKTRVGGDYKHRANFENSKETLWDKRITQRCSNFLFHPSCIYPADWGQKHALGSPALHFLLFRVTQSQWPWREPRSMTNETRSFFLNKAFNLSQIYSPLLKNLASYFPIANLQNERSVQQSLSLLWEGQNIPLYQQHDHSDGSWLTSGAAFRTHALPGGVCPFRAVD